MRKAIRPTLILVYTLIGAFVLLEMALRLFDPIGIAYYSDTRRYFKAMTPDPDFGYIHTPGYHARLQGVDVSINNEGFRGPPFEPTKPPGEKRLMILGDSVVFGWGAPQDSIFPALLQRRLASGLSGWRVIPAGVGSWNTRAEYEFLKKRGAAYDPDILVLVVVANDVEPSSAGSRVVDTAGRNSVSLPHRIVRRLARYSYAIAAFYHLLRQRNTSDTLTELYDADAAAWRDASAALDAMIRLGRKEGMKLVVFLYGDFKTDFSKAFYKRYGDYLSKRDISAHTLPETIYDKRYRNSIVDGHPNAAGHRLIEQEIFRVIAPLL